MGYDQLMRPQRAGQGAEYATLNPNAVSPAFLKSLINCSIENDLWETEPGTVQMNDFAIASLPTIGTVFQFFPESGVSRIIACGRNGTVWVSSDDGKTFRLLSSAMPPNRLIVPVTGGKEVTGNRKKLFLFGGDATLVLAGDADVDVGLATPTTGPTLATVAESGAINPGDHDYVYTFGNAIGETAPSGRTTISVNNPKNAKVDVRLPLGPAGTTYRKVYRTKAAGDVTTLFLLTLLNDNTTTDYQDNTPDGSLGTQVAPVRNATASVHVIARPPADWTGGNQPIGGFILEGRMAGFGNNNQVHGLYYSTREDHEDFLSAGSGFLPVFTGKGDGIKAGVYWRSQGWLLKSPRGIYRVDTSNIDPAQWQVHEHSDSVGCVGPMALTLIQGADDSQFYDDVIFISPDGGWHRMSKTAAYQSGDVNASSISETTYGEFIRANVDKSRLPFCQLIYFDEIEEVWGGFTQIGASLNKLRIKASLKRLPEFGIRFHHSTFPECEGLALIINPDSSRTPIAGGSLGSIKRCYQKVYTDAGTLYEPLWETWDDNFQDLGENYKVSLKNYHFLVVEGLSVGDWPMFVEVYIDGVLQPTLLSVSMKGKGSQFILDQSHLDQQALGATKPLFVVTRLRGRGHRIRYRGFIATTIDPGFGQLWTHEAVERPQVANPACSVFIDDLTVYAFHLDTPSGSLYYDVSTDGGKTFPSRVLTNTSGGRPFAVRPADDPPTRVFLLIESGGSPDIIYNPTASNFVTSMAGVILGAPGTGTPESGQGLEVSGQKALLVMSVVNAGIHELWVWRCANALAGGGPTFQGPVQIAGETAAPGRPLGFQTVCTPSAGVWCFINANSGKIFRSVDNGATWSAAVKTITAGNAALANFAAIFAVSATRLVAVYKGQVAVSDDAGLTWTDKQNLTLICPVDVKQAGIGHIANFGVVSGLAVLGGATTYAMEFDPSTTRQAMWRSTDLGETWTLVNAIGGGLVTSTTTPQISGFVARKGRGVVDIYSFKGGYDHRDTWFNPSTPIAAGHYFKIQQIQTGFSLGGFSGGNK